ncbi:hypothetical protein E2C01_072812 [Portunus trituberculatus]|uniref:Uncharacterized protein n=1 Tax=Portunus trituberculatus TaxID=210409 RepID=A0A5B7IBN9_PORTR|nr:hypothetical protein [Portunus trituberculatus]
METRYGTEGVKNTSIFNHSLWRAVTMGSCLGSQSKEQTQPESDRQVVCSDGFLWRGFGSDGGGSGGGDGGGMSSVAYWLMAEADWLMAC